MSAVGWNAGWRTSWRSPHDFAQRTAVPEEVGVGGPDLATPTGETQPLGPRDPSVARPIDGRFIIGFQPGTDGAERSRIVSELGATVLREIPFIDAVVIQVENADPSAAAALQATSSAIAWAQPDFMHPPVGELHRSRPGPTSSAAPTRGRGPDDPLFDRQWSLRNTGSDNGVAGADIGATDAWRVSTGRGVVVAVTDTRVNASHPDLRDNMWRNPGEIAGNKLDDDRNGFVDDVHGWSFGEGFANVEEGAPWDHGTHVSGTIAAVADNGIGVVGVAPDAKIMALPVAGSRGTITSNGIEAFAYAAANGAKVVNASWGDHIYEPALAAATRKLAEHDVLLVVAAGNGWRDTGANPSYPDNYPGAMSVAASNRRDKRERESNWGTATVDIAAPGTDILSTAQLIDPYLEMTGTSMAAPHVVGVAALVKARYPELTMAQVGERILRSAERDGSARGWRRLVSSGGRLDAAAALMPIATPANPTVRPSANAGRLTAGAPATASWSADVVGGQRFDVELMTDANARGTVDETFERERLRRPEDLSLSAGPGRNRLRRTRGAGTDGSWGLRSPMLGRGGYARLDLHETVVDPTKLSFDVRGHGSLEDGLVSVFVDGELQFPPRPPTAAWHNVEVDLAPGEHTIAIFLSRPVYGFSDEVGFDVDNVRIGKVSDGTWLPLGTTDAGSTSLTFTPAAATGAAALRVRANNGRWTGPWVHSDQFAIAPPQR